MQVAERREKCEIITYQRSRGRGLIREQKLMIEMPVA
jgi:hypothetical protein